ncbi:uncharacterized protein LOC106350893 [Brassica napus]|uniref:uncharacterized protein LOC106350893 n=1 Tax=Brassica napus TaxID=3708 RepID=UPI002078942D|nr:uncharacterized protein LOC106350893 [Brassica napus]
MSSSLDRALLAMTLDEDDEPFDLPDLPQYSSCQNNSISLIGRFLNPDCQKMSNLIREMPRKWQKFDRVRGVALSSERFQFIFKHEHDLVEVYEKGVHCLNDWSLAMERWVEKPPEDYLNYVFIWVRLRNIPVNHYTLKAITALGDLVGEVVEVAFDPSKPQINDYVRVKIRFNVSKPLRKSKVVNLPSGGQTSILYEYERIHKRCFHCQRLTHEQTVCPIKLRSLQRASDQLPSSSKISDSLKELVLKEPDPLFGVLEENQVGINPSTGRPRIAKEVLDGMRLYLLSASGPEKIIREQRVKASLADIGNDPVAQKSFLSLEAIPSVTSEVDKGKGPVFDFEKHDNINSYPQVPGYHTKLLASAIQAGGIRKESFVPQYYRSEGSANNSFDDMMAYSEFSSVNAAMAGEAGSSCTAVGFRAGKARRRPSRNKRQIVDKDSMLQQRISKEGSNNKRKADEQVGGVSLAKRKLGTAVPLEGLPNFL